MTEQIIHKNKYATLISKSFTKHDGTDGEHLVFTSGSGFGAVIVPVVNVRGINYFGLIEEYRLPVNDTVLGFPRGGAEEGSSSIETAHRELAEETGIEKCELVFMGTLQPDNGIMNNEVDVFFAQTYKKPEGHVDAVNGGTTQWLSYGELLGKINNGQIKCGFTIAALMMVIASGRLR